MGAVHLILEQKEKENKEKGLPVGYTNGHNRNMSSFTNKKDYERERVKARRKEDPEKWRTKDAANRTKHKEKIKAVQKAWRAKNKNYLHNRAKEDIAKYLYESAAKRAKVKGREFSIDVHEVVVPERCPVLGLKLAVHKGIKAFNSPSIDRIDSAKGYVSGNVRVISIRANWLKSNGTLEEFEAIVRYMKS